MNILKELVGATGKNATQFAKVVERHPNRITKNIRDGGNIMTDTLAEFAKKNNLKVKIEIISGNARTIIEL